MIRYLIVLSCLLLTTGSMGQSPAYKDSEFTEYFRRTSGWVASDGSISVPLPEGKSLWLMGDSHIDGYNAADNTIPCLFQVRNAILVQDILQPSQFTTILDNTQTGVNRTPVKLGGGDPRYFWPAHGYAKRDTAIVFWQLYEGASMTHVGNYASKIYTRELKDASAIKKLQKLPIPDEFEFGTTVVVDSTRSFIYLYGFKKDWIIFRPYVARIPLGQDVFSVWEFYNGTDWEGDVEASAQIMASTDDYVSPSFSVLKLEDKYYLISQDIGFLECGLGREIYSWESDHPEGPFTNKKLLYTIEDQYNGEYMITYNATAHPEFIKDNELLISYNVNGVCTGHCTSPFTDRYQADLYRPKFIRVPLDYIDPTLDVPDPVYPQIPPVTGVDDECPDVVEVFPNPSRGALSLVSACDDDEIQWVVKNAFGALVMEGAFEGSTELRIGRPGFYFFTASRGDGRTVTRKVVVY